MQIDKITKGLDAANATIDNLQTQLISSKNGKKKFLTDMHSEIENAISTMPFGEIRKYLSDIYWSSEEVASTITKVYRNTIGGNINIVPKEFETFCSDKCGKSQKLNFTSWNQYKAQKSGNWNYAKTWKCEDCLKIEVAQAELRKAEKIKIQGEINRLRSLPYAEYLKTDHWQSTRKVALRRANFSCQLCNKNVSLDVHHRTYKNLGHEESSDLTVLCRDCHSKHHNKIAVFTQQQPLEVDDVDLF
jgi:hypothetical protein